MQWRHCNHRRRIVASSAVYLVPSLMMIGELLEDRGKPVAPPHVVPEWLICLTHCPINPIASF